jgi:hypothetical protein
MRNELMLGKSLKDASLMRALRFALAFAGMFTLAAATHAETFCAANQSLQVQVGAQTFNVSIAASDFARQRGLSGRPHLNKEAGMWFVFPEPGVQGFWMHGMNFPIDLIWLSATGHVLGAISLQPCDDQACPIHLPPAPVGSVLEINAGEFAGKVGDGLTWRCVP